MGVLWKLRDAIRQTGYDMEQDIYTGKADRYVVYNIAAESPSGFADDMPLSDTLHFQVHIFLPRKIDYQPVQKKLRDLLLKAGFSYPSVGLNMVEKETGIRHICLETNIESEV